MSSILRLPVGLATAQRDAALADLLEHGFVVLGRKEDASRVASAAIRADVPVDDIEQLPGGRFWVLRRQRR